jgi:large subunit ribosomal protein L18
MHDHKSRFNRRRERLRIKIAQYSDRARLSVFKSNQHIYAQIIDDSNNRTLVSASTLEKDIKNQKKSNCNIRNAEIIGNLIGERACAQGIKEVVFDKGGYKYHGLIKSLADSARKFLNF